MSTVIDPSLASKEFEEKMKERLRQSFGDLMPDDVLQKIVARGIEDAFFKPQIVPDKSSYYGSTKELPSWLILFAQSECRKVVEEQVREWFLANGDKVQEVVRDVLKENLLTSVIGAAVSIFDKPFNQLQSALAARLEQLDKSIQVQRQF